MTSQDPNHALIKVSADLSLAESCAGRVRTQVVSIVLPRGWRPLKGSLKVSSTLFSTDICSFFYFPHSIIEIIFIFLGILSLM